MKKVLWIDFKERRCMDVTIESIIEEGFDVQIFPWTMTEREISNIDEARKAAEKVDFVMVHFGSIPRGKAAELLSVLKGAQAKIIVNSGSPISFEEADWVLPLPFWTEELISILKQK